MDPVTKGELRPDAAVTAGGRRRRPASPVDGTGLANLAEPLAAALELIGEAVVILDTTPRIVHANEAAVRLAGCPREDLIGAGPRAGHGLLPDPTMAADVWDLLARGSAWRGTQYAPQSSPAKRPRPLDVAVTPVCGRQAGPVGYVAVVRDISEESRQAQERQREADDRTAVLSVMGQVRTAGTAEATSEVLCRAVTTIAGFDGAMLLLRPRNGDLVHVTTVGPPVAGMEYGAALPLSRLEQLVAVTHSGPWFLDMAGAATAALVGADLHRAFVSAGITASAYSAVRADGDLIGVLSVTSTAPDGPAVLAARLGILEQLGALAGSVLGTQADQFGRHQARRDAVRDVIENRRFTSVVQPLVRLDDGRFVGCEALTRFDDGRPPPEWFEDAHAVGLGGELEEACARLAIEQSAPLPRDWSLGVNLSAEAVLSGTIGRLAAASDRPLTIEITEHVRIDSYQAVRQAISGHPGIDVAVDDAGAGFASLRHILELQPQFVKLDLGLVRDVDHDPARSALVAGMRHFAVQTGTRLVAEGVETEAEARTLRALGVELAQGYLYARPQPATDLAALVARRRGR